MSNSAANYDAVVIGAGYSGIRSLWEFDRLGLTVKCYDTASDVGGTWFYNRYPGSRTDGEAWVYLLNFAPELLEEWDFRERYPSQEAIQSYLARITDRYNLRRHIQFETKVTSAHYNDSTTLWTITTSDGASTTCRYFIAATGILSIPNDPPFPGLKNFKGEWYQAAKWPSHDVDFREKRIAVVGVGSTGVHLIPKLAPIAKDLTVFQRTPNYVLPGRNYALDEYQAYEIKKNHNATWELATNNIAGHAFAQSGRTVRGTDSEKIKRVLDSGWERGCFNFQLETFDDAFMDPESNEVVSEYIRNRIRAIVEDPQDAELLCPKYPFGAKRPPSGHYFYEAFNRPNVHLVDISKDEIDMYENGIRTSSGTEYEFDMIILAVGYDAGTGALNRIDIRGKNQHSLKEHWTENLETFAGVLVSDFPNMFIVCGPHMPAGNQPTFLEISVDWVGKTIQHMEKNDFAQIDVKKEAALTWSEHAEGLWNSVFISKPATEHRSWFVGTNVPGKPAKIMFYFGGIPNWRPWLDSEVQTLWASMNFTPREGKPAREDSPIQDQPSVTNEQSIAHPAVTGEALVAVEVAMQADEIGLSAPEKFNIVSAACARYISWAVQQVQDKALDVKDDHRRYWWKTLQDFVASTQGQELISQSPDTQEELEELCSQLGVEGEAVARVGPNLAQMLTGQVNPLQLILKDDLLFRIYSADEGLRPNKYVAEYAKMLTAERKDLKILEIGAGTGGTTLQILQACSPDGEAFCSEYMYTDISNGFFITGQNALKKWDSILTYQTLDIQNEPKAQGFVEHSYDLIVTANCIHATRSLSTTLGNIHKLLKPGGVLGLVELTRLTPYFNICFGPLEGWWAGVGEGRIESPLQTADQWNIRLKDVGFSGVDVVAYDLPEPERHSALMLSTALSIAPAADVPEVTAAPGI